MSARRSLSTPQAVPGYTVGKLLGKGKFSEVFKGVHDSDGAEVAIKQVRIEGMGDLMDADDRASYRKEVELLADLQHPNIVQFYEWIESEDGEYLFIVMELAQIGDLSKLIKKARSRGKPLVERTIWKLFFQIAAGLKHMHSSRIMHRDLKPANVFVSSGGRVKLGDLGLGRKFSSQTRSTESLVGTPYYMAPERINEGPYEFSSDIWSLGCLLYEMAALRNPFYGKAMNLYTLCEKIDTCDYPPLPEHYSQDLVDLVGSIIVRDPSARPDINDVYAKAKAMVQSFMDG